jgi:hypothetical protein
LTFFGGGGKNGHFWSFLAKVGGFVKKSGEVRQDQQFVRWVCPVVMVMTERQTDEKPGLFQKRLLCCQKKKIPRKKVLRG